MVHSPNRKYIDKIIEESRRMMGVMIERYSCRTLAVSYIRKHCGAGTGISYWAVGISSASSVVSHGSGTYIARNPIRLTLPSPPVALDSTKAAECPERLTMAMMSGEVDGRWKASPHRLQKTSCYSGLSFLSQSSVQTCL